MWVLVDAKLIARKVSFADDAAQAQIFSEAMKLYMTNIIQEKKYSPKPAGSEPADDKHCAKCGRELTQGELGFLEGMTGPARLCYHCTH